jgi:hypothetical protein
MKPTKRKFYRNSSWYVGHEKSYSHGNMLWSNAYKRYISISWKHGHLDAASWILSYTESDKYYET